MKTKKSGKIIEHRQPPKRENKTHAVAVRMTPSDVERLMELARAVGVGHSVLASVIIQDYIKHPRPIFGMPDASEKEENDDAKG